MMSWASPRQRPPRRQRAALSIIAGGRPSCVGGLYGCTRKRSVQPQMQAVREDAISVSSEDHDDRVPTMSTRKISCQQAPRKTPPQTTVPPKSWRNSSPRISPPSPIPSAVSQVVSAIGRDTTALVQEVRQHQRSMAVEGHRLLKNTQGHVDNGCILHENNGVRCSYNICPRENEGAEARAPCTETVSVWTSVKTEKSTEIPASPQSSTLTPCEVQSMDK
ncbi:hypothetical protein JB92DRAFT_3052446 [Gautieria morchelliformis]|nr:hypothetical protein JB92DRAFT_3052446 [Gautieria morchelliformis]